jgi:HD-GYP domain-containing protein (c-di-GMP phosphodiesterase class II)
MSYQRVFVPTQELEVGMYIVDLDRPWLETPFLFQGFRIENDNEIDEVQKHCKQVFVDMLQSDTQKALNKLRCLTSEDAEKAGLSGQTRKLKELSGQQLRSADLDEQAGQFISHADTSELRKDVLEARQVHEQTAGAIDAIFNSLRNGKELDIEAAEKAVEPMVECVMGNEDALSWLARMKQKDDYIHDHSLASCVWAMIFGKYLGLEKSSLQVLGLGALLMDVGKTRISTDLLVKTSQISREDALLLQRHVEFGVEIARPVDGVDHRVIEIVESHHERYNGTGYPKGLKGSEIPVYGRIAGIVDSYDAMTTCRPYAAPVSTHLAMRKLNELAGVEFQVEMVEQFIQAVGIFPVGTLLELSSGEVGVVVGQNKIRRLRPQVMLLTDESKTPLQSFKVIDLRNQLVDAAGESLYIECGLPPGAYGINPSEYYL